MESKDMASGEQWLPVCGYENLYEVSSLGRVKSKHFSKSKVMSLVYDRKGYATVLFCDNKVRARRKVHRLVCGAFNPDGDTSLQVAHVDGDRSNNQADNLRWSTASENEQDKLRHGTLKYGENSHLAKISSAVVGLIRSDTRPAKAVAEQYGVSVATIYDIKKGKRRAHG